MGMSVLDLIFVLECIAYLKECSQSATQKESAMEPGKTPMKTSLKCPISILSISRRGAIGWDIKDCCHFLAKSCGEGAHGSVFSTLQLMFKLGESIERARLQRWPSKSSQNFLERSGSSCVWWFGTGKVMVYRIMENKSSEPKSRGGVSLLPLPDPRRRLIRERGDVTYLWSKVEGYTGQTSLNLGSVV